MLSLSLPFGKGEAEAAERLCAERLHPHRQRRPDRPDHALCRDGAGHLYLDPDADRRRARSGPEAGAAGTRAAERKALRQSAAGRAGDRQFERHARGVEAAARGRREPRGSCWSRPRPNAGTSIRHPAARKAARCSTRRQGRRLKYGELAADAAHMPVPENVTLKRPEDFKLIGTPAKRLDTPAKVNGTAVYGIDVRPPGVKIATLAQSPVFGGRLKSRGRYGGKGRQGRAPDRSARRRRCGRGRSYGRGQKGPGGAQDRMGRRSARQAHHGRRSRANSSRRRSARARWRRTSVTPTRPWRAPPPRSRRSTSFRSWRTPRWSR